MHGRALFVVFFVGGGSGCGQSPADLPTCFDSSLDLSICDPDAVSFSSDPVNPWFPLTPGPVAELEGEEGGEQLRSVRTVLAGTESIEGVEVRVLMEEDYVDGELEEIVRLYYAETADGVVCAFGEDVEEYVDGALDVSLVAWRVGVDGAMPAIAMPADPQAGDTFHQEAAPKAEAASQGRVDATDLTLSFEGQTYDVIQLVDADPIDPDDPCLEDEVRFAAGLGQVMDAVMELVSFTPGG